MHRSKFYILKLLIIKNIKSHLSMWYIVLLELLIAIVIPMALISANRFYVKNSEFVRESIDTLEYEDRLNLSTVDHLMNLTHEHFWLVSHTIVYTPKGPWQEKLAMMVGKKLNLEVKYVPLSKFNSYLIEGHVFCGIHFNTSSLRLPKYLNYSLVFPAYIRSQIPISDADYKYEDFFWKTREDDIGFERKQRSKNDTDVYYNEGFLSVQNAVFQSFLQMLYTQYHSEKLDEFEFREFPINMKQMPYPKHSDVLSIIRPGTFWVEVIFYVSYMLPTVYLTYFISKEYESQNHVFLAGYGVNYVLHWIAHILVAFLRLQLLNVFVITLTTINWGSYQTGESLYHGDENSDFFIMYLMFMMFNLALVMFSFLMAIIVEGQLQSIVLSFLVNLLFRSMYIIVIETTDTVPTAIRFFLYFMYTNLFSDHILFLNEMEIRDMPISWDNIAYGNYVWFWHFGILFMCSIIYGFLIWYYQETRAGHHLESKRWNYICCFSSSRMIHDRDYAGVPVPAEYIEFGPYGKKECLVVNRVCKYLNGQSILSNLTFKAYEGEITVLLGHKQSGQGLAINIISGLISPTSGHILIYGQESTTAYSKSKIAVCPPMNCFFECLSAEEYLAFRMNLKGIGVVERKQQIEKWASVCAFDFKRKINTLSYDEKRILSLVSCIVGGTKIIIMYDPTSNMTPIYRSKFWRIMRENVDGRSFVVATNSIDEATIIGNRIGILMRGELKCYGTQFFLKKKFAEGYRLSLIIEKKAETHKITSFLRGFIHKAEVEHHVGVNLTYLVPQSLVRKLPVILSRLDALRGQFKIKSFGVMGRTLEEVFLKVEDHIAKQKFKKPELSLLGKIKMLTGKELRNSRLHALAFRRICSYRPNNFPLAVMLFTLVSFYIISGLEQTHTTSERWYDINKNATFKHQLIHAYLEPQSGNKNSLYQNFSAEFTKTISASLDILCKDCSLSLQSKEAFFGDMPYNSKKKIKSKYLYEEVQETYSDISFTYFSPVTPKPFMKDVDTRILEKISNKDEPSLTIYFSMQSQHISYRALNLIQNFVLISLFGQKYGINCKNDPLEIPVMFAVDFIDEARLDFGIIYVIGTCVPFLISYFAFLMVRERSSQLKKYQILSGVSLPMYWILNATWDYATYLVYISVFSMSFLFLNIPGFTHEEKITTVGFMMFYGISGIAFVYILSFFFQDENFAFTSSTVINLILGAYIFDLIARLMKYWLLMKYIFVALPQFALVDAIHLIFRNGYIKEVCSNHLKNYFNDKQKLCEQDFMCCDHLREENFKSFQRDGILLHLVSLSISPFVFYAIIFLLEYLHEVKRINWRSKIYPLNAEEKDPAYVREKKRIKQLTWVEKNDYRVVVDRLEGEMEHSSFFQTVSFTLEEGSILGIIGLPNAGRRELCYKIAGLSRYTYGDVFIEGHDLRNFKREDLNHLSFGFHQGGSPRGLHVKDLLQNICMCRGVPQKLIRPLIAELRDCLCLHDGMGSFYSIKKRMAIALALVANINIMILDEPTTNLDPLSRRVIWQTLLYVRSLGKTIIFSASSFYEGEVLADRILFHVDGGVYGLGPIQELRSRITKAICVEVQLLKDGLTQQEVKENYEFDMANLLKFMEYLSPNYKILKSLSAGTLSFYLPFEEVNWAKLLDIFEKQKQKLRITDYCFKDYNIRDILYPSDTDRSNI